MLRNEKGRFRSAPEIADTTDIDIVQYGIWLAAGMSVDQLADRLEISRTAVYGQIKSAGLPTPNQLHQTLAARLRTRMTPMSHCLLWTGGTTPQGYPCISVGGTKRSVSHLLLARNGQALPSRAVVRTSCRHIRCVALHHLEIVSAAEVPALTARAGRTSAGERHWNARLSWDAVDVIRSDSAPALDLAELHGVSTATIDAVRSHRRWNNAVGRAADTDVDRSTITTPVR